VGCVFAVSVCGEQGKFPTTPTGTGTGTGNGSGSDAVSPNIYIILPAPPHDTIQDITDSLKFTMADTDNVRLKSVQVTVSGIAPYSFNFIDSAVVGVAGFVKSYAIPLKRGAPGHHLKIAATAYDASGNLGAKTDTILIVDQKPPVLTMVSPAGSTTIGAGSTFKVVTSASDVSGVLFQGARLYTVNNLNQRVVLVADTTFYPTAPGNKTDTISVHIPATVAPGAYSLQSFARDSSPTPNDTVSGSQAIQVITVLAPFGGWVFPPQDTAVVAGSNFVASFDAKDSAGVASLVFSAFSDSGNVSLGTFGTRPRYTAPGATMTSPFPRDTTIQRLFTSVPDSSIDSAFIAATVTNVGGVSATITRRIQVIKGPFVQVTKPVTGARVPTGVADSVGLTGYAPAGIQWLGFRATGVAPAGDSIQYAAPYAATQTTVRYLTVPSTTALGVDTIVPFAVSGQGVRFTGKPAIVTFADTVKPGVTVLLPSKVSLLTVAVGDSVLTRVHVTDNRGVAKLVLTGQAKRGVDSLGTLTLKDRYQAWNITLPQSPDTIVTRYLVAATPIDSTGELVYIVATATDSSGNTRADTSTVRVVSGPKVSILTPANNAVTAPNKQLTISVYAQGGQGVHYLGYRALGVFNKSDSVIASPVNGKLLDTLTFTRTDTIPAATVPGTFAITAFAVDSTGNPSAGIPGVVVTVLPIGAADTVPPLVQFTVPLRVEAGDSISVTATDPSGITKVGFIARDSVGTILHGDSVVFGGGGTYISQKFRLGLDTVTTFPRVVTIEAFAVDNATPTPNRGVSVAPTSTTPAKNPPTAAFRDTLTLVAGSTIAFPQGGQFGDAIVDPNNQTLYLTNTLLDQLEVFHLIGNSFGPPIRVGSQPVGIALWPRDTLGDNRDTVIVANSGGTNLSIVDVVAGAEVARHKLPDYIVSTVKTQPTAAGGVEVLYTPYDLSDRPQYVATTCRHLTAGACDSVIAVYSTTPTPAATGPFANHGYLAWENLTAPPSATSGHFFWELATSGTDTIQIDAIRDTLQGQPLRYTILGAGAAGVAYGNLLSVASLAFQESTFVRNSGDFNHAVIGEGGLNQGFARALAFDARVPLTVVSRPPCPLLSPTNSADTLALLNCSYVTDNGVSYEIFISDFLVNRASKVLSVATNFNGRTNLVRADSIYAFDGVLKQAGLFSVGGTNPGMDFDPNNAFDATTRTSGTLNKNDRLVFAARPDAGIDVFDEYWYQRVATIPIRDTIIGPIRVANSGGVLVLVGVTSRGLVVVRLPNFTNPFPSAPPRPSVSTPLVPVTPQRPQVAAPHVPVVPTARKPVPVP
jgi:hypothetical protein